MMMEYELNFNIILELVDSCENFYENNQNHQARARTLVVAALVVCVLLWKQKSLEYAPETST